jgi:hypothetical protein
MCLFRTQSPHDVLMLYCTEHDDENYHNLLWITRRSWIAPLESIATPVLRNRTRLSGLTLKHLAAAAVQAHGVLTSKSNFSNSKVATM